MERDKKIKELRLRKIKEYEDVFSVNLGKEHRINCEPIHTELVDDYADKNRTNVACPRSIHADLQSEHQIK